PSRRDSITRMKNVKASSRATPSELFLFFSMANIRPKAPTRNTMALRPGLAPITWLMPVYRPTAAPRTVGTRDSASSQYVLRSTLFRTTSPGAPAYAPERLKGDGRVSFIDDSYVRQKTCLVSLDDKST